MMTPAQVETTRGNTGEGRNIYAETPWNELWELSKDDTNRKAREELHNRQLRYWQEKETNKSLLKAVDAFTVFLGELKDSISKLRMEFESLANKHPR